MKSFRKIFFSVEIISLIIIFIFIITVFFLIRNNIKTNFVKNQISDIKKVDILIKDFVTENLKVFDHSYKTQKLSYISSLTQFSDIYIIDNNFKIEQIMRTDSTSKIFLKFEVSNPAIINLTHQLKTNETSYSPLVRASENGLLSIYFMKKLEKSFLIGRINLERILANLNKLSYYSESTYILASKDGYILSETGTPLSINVMNNNSINELVLNNKVYIVTRIPSEILQNDIIMITPQSKVFNIINTVKKYFAGFVLLLTLIYLFRLFYLNTSIFKPLRKFTEYINVYDIETDFPKRDKYLELVEYKELFFLYQNYFGKIDHIRNLISELKEKQTSYDLIRVYLKNILDSLPSALITIDHRGTIHELNQAAEKLFSLSKKQATGFNIWLLLPVLQKYQIEAETVFSSLISKTIPKDTLTEIDDKYFSINIFPLFEHKTEEIVIRIEDISLLEKTEQQLRQAQKMESIGNLVGGIAHDFNNILAGIVGAVSLLKMEYEMGITTNIQEYISIMESSSQRATDMINQLLTLSNRQKMTIQTTDINQIIQQVVKMCSTTFDKKVSIDFKPTLHQVLVEADSLQLEQVFLNLLINSMHAMTIMREPDQFQGGNIVIMIDKFIADSTFLAKHQEAKEKKEYWKITLQDTGVGIPSEIRGRIFDPFFSTKVVGKGSGLGLTMVYNIIKHHLGFIDVYSEPDSGTCFFIYLPISNQEKTQIVHKKENMVMGTGSILIVDDEEMVRNIASKMLESCGFSVHTAGNGSEGVNFFNEHFEEIDLVILDINMPVMSGVDAFPIFKRIKPSIKVLIATGFVRDEKAELIMKMGANGFLQKPYTLYNLSKEVDRILNSC